MSASSLSEDEFENALNDALAQPVNNYDSDDVQAADDDAVNSYDSDDAQEEIDAFEREEAARVAAMTEEERAAYEEQKKLDEAQRQLEEELAEQLRKDAYDKRSGAQKNRQAFARGAYDEMTKGKNGYDYKGKAGWDVFDGGKKRTIRKKNRKGTRTIIRKRQRKNRTRTMRKKARKSRNSNKTR